jgi:hypothetical protein
MLPQVPILGNEEFLAVIITPSSIGLKEGEIARIPLVQRDTCASHLVKQERGSAVEKGHVQVSIAFNGLPQIAKQVQLQVHVPPFSLDETHRHVNVTPRHIPPPDLGAKDDDEVNIISASDFR